MPVVRGDNVALFLFDDAQWKLCACGRSGTLNVSTETIDTTVSGSGKWRSRLPTVNSFAGSFDGVVFLVEPGKLTLPQIRTKQTSHEILLFRMQRTDEGGNIYTSEGRIIITNTTDTGTYNDVNTFSVEFTGTGALTSVFTHTPVPIPNTEMRYEYTGGGGEYDFEATDLENKYILEVVKDGVGCSRIITSGTPVGKEAKYIAGHGQISFAVPLEPGEEVYVLYRDI